VPMVFTSDREYNSFGGYIDKAHSAFGNAYDPELAYALASFYGKAMAAIGIHVTFEPYANEIGAQYGENPELIGAIIFACKLFKVLVMVMGVPFRLNSWQVR